MFDKLCRDTVGLPSGRSPILHQMVWLGMFQGGWNGFAAQRNKLSCRPTLGVNYTQLAPDEKSCGSWRISVTPKASAGCKSTLAFGSSHERPVAERRYFAVNSHVSLRPCASAAQSGVKGYYPLREACRRAAVFRSQVTCLPTPLRARGAVRGQGVLPLARGPSPSGGISQPTHMSPYAPARPRRSPGSRGTTPCARPVAERRYFAANSHVSLHPCAPTARSPGSRGTTPCARPVAERRYLRSQLTCLPMPLRAAGAQSERGTQSPILPRTMKRAPSKV